MFEITAVPPLVKRFVDYPLLPWEIREGLQPEEGE